MLKVEVYRYNPETDQAPYMKSYDIDTQGKDLMVLDVLELINPKILAWHLDALAVKVSVVLMV